MAAKQPTVDVELRLPKVTLRALDEIAKLAGVPTATVLQVAVATQVWRWKAERQPRNQP